MILDFENWKDYPLNCIHELYLERVMKMILYDLIIAHIILFSFSKGISLGDLFFLHLMEL